MEVLVERMGLRVWVGPTLLKKLKSVEPFRAQQILEERMRRLFKPTSSKRVAEEVLKKIL
jgi:hypothetical protein